MATTVPWYLRDILLGPATFGRLHRLDLIVGHTGEEPGFSRDYAVRTTIWQRTNPGSYSFRIYDAASEGSRGGIMLTVPYLEASGGINPASAYWAPERFPFLERELAKAGPCPVDRCPGPYRNPTMHAGQISFTGRTDQLKTDAPANYVPDAERLIAWYDKAHPLRGPAPLVLVMHAHWQRNRSDWGAWMHATLTEAEMSWHADITRVDPFRVLLRRQTSYRRRPDLSPESEPVVLDVASWRTIIGTVAGADFGAGPTWLVLVSESGGLKVAHAQDELEREALVPESESGVSAEQLAAAELNAHAGGWTEGHEATVAAAKAVEPS